MTASGPPQPPPEEGSQWHGHERRGDLLSTSPEKPAASSAASVSVPVDEHERTIRYLEHTSGEIFKSIGRILRTHDVRIATVYRLVTSPSLRDKITTIDWAAVEKQLIDSGILAPPPGKFRKFLSSLKWLTDFFIFKR